MDLFIFILFYIIATIIGIKTISYGIFEIKEKNIFGGSLVIFITIAAYVLFAVLMYLQ